MMSKPFSLACSALALSLMGSSGATAQTVELPAMPDVPAETLTPADIEAARGTAAIEAARSTFERACFAQPDATLRVVTAAAPGGYVDLPCTSMFGRDESTMETSADPSSEPIGEARQKIGPITFVACGLILGGSALFLNKVLCPAGRTAEARNKCNDIGLGGGIALGSCAASRSEAAMDRPLRVLGILVCGLLLAAPAVVCVRGASPRLMDATHTVSILFPVTFWALSRLFVAEGREREREDRARERERETRG